MECKREKNLEGCICTEKSCPKQGICCECVRYHRERGELPGCFFTKEEEATYNRSIEYFVKNRQK